MTRPAVPDRVRVALGHGYVQTIGDRARIDLLHVKGPALHPALIGTDEFGHAAVRESFDADVLVRPADADRLVSLLMSDGWHRINDFRTGSAFGHAVTMRHPHLGLLDVHRHWPGFTIEHDAAFDLLWSARLERTIAHVVCAVPSVEDQRLLILTHAARSAGLRADDIRIAWSEAGVGQQQAARANAVRFGAEVALAAATGELELYRGDPDHRLWEHFATASTSRLDEWRGRWASAAGWRRKAQVAGDFLRVNPDRLRDEVGSEPSVRDWLSAYRRRIERAVRDVSAGRRGR